MLNMIPEELFATAFQLAAFCITAFTALVACLFVPRG